MDKIKSQISKFTIRVYGLCIMNGKILLVNENLNGIRFTKFPGGGLEFGEGLRDALKREIKEELNLDCDILQHFYTSDFFQQSAFNNKEQLISVYFYIKLLNPPPFEIFPLMANPSQNHSLEFYWINIDRLHETMVNFPIDKTVVSMLKT